MKSVSETPPPQKKKEEEKNKDDFSFTFMPCQREIARRGRSARSVRRTLNAETPERPKESPIRLTTATCDSKQKYKPLKGNGHYWLLLKIIVSIQTYSLTISGELLIV